MKNLIVGAGLSGSILANLIANKLNEEVLVIDRRPVVAGNICDYKDKETGINIHKYGVHVFHTNNSLIWNYLSEYTQWHYFVLRPKAVMEGNLATIPFNLTTLYEVFSDNFAQKLEEKLIKTFGYGKKISILELMKYEDDDLKFISTYVYENMFKNYTLKQWGVKPEEIDSSVTARVPVLISHDNRYFQDKYQGIPKYGYTKLIENLLNHPNITVQLNTDFKEVTCGFDRVFYSGSIDEYFNYKYGKLPYRSLIFDVQTINKEYYQPVSMVNYPNNYDFTRITEHKYFLDEKSDKTVISFEYPKAFVLGENERFYPIKNEVNQKLYDKYKNEADKIKGLYFIGRLGEYKYYNMDTAIEKIFELFNKELLK